MFIKQYKPYISHDNVNIGDVIMFKCKSLPKVVGTKTKHLNYGDHQIWNVVSVEKNSVRLQKRSGRHKGIKMILHDYKINKSILSLEFSTGNYQFKVYCSEIFTFNGFLNRLLSKLKHKLKW